MKEGIQFHGDYGELTAEDVKFSYERVADPEVEADYADDSATLGRVEVIDKYSGRIILEEKGQKKFATNPIGAGPYQFEEWNRER